MFRGSYEAKITEGRLKLPTDFEKLVVAANIKQFYITSPNGKSAEIWPLQEWEKREARLRNTTLSCLTPHPKYIPQSWLSHDC